MNLGRLVRSELLKLRTTKAWWIVLLLGVLATVLAGGVRMLQLHNQLRRAEELPPHLTPEQLERYKAVLALRMNTLHIASDLFTSGQFLGCLLAMLLGVLLVTSEYQHQTATTTFLTTPTRVPVVVAKLIAALVMAFLLWALSTALGLAGGTWFLSSKELPRHWGEWALHQSILFNLMMYGLWSVFGVGWGVVWRNQLGGTISAALGYVLGSQMALIVFTLVHQFWIKEDWVYTAMVIVPTKAAEVAVSPTKTYLQSPAQWVGIAVMLAYGLGLAAVGTALIRRRDVT